jgi:hypothetical protein
MNCQSSIIQTLTKSWLRQIQTIIIFRGIKTNGFSFAPSSIGYADVLGLRNLLEFDWLKKF